MPLKWWKYPNFFMLAATGLSSYLFLVVGDDTPDKVGVGVVECLHEASQLLLVRLAHGVEHAFTRPRAEGGLRNSGTQSHNLS